MTVEKINVVPIYNPRSGNQSAIGQVHEDVVDLGNKLIKSYGPINFFTADEEKLLQSVNGQTLFAIYGGDGTFFSSLGKLHQLINQKKIDPQQIALVAMGHPDYGGERVAASMLGTNNKPLKQIVDYVLNFENQAFFPLSPWSAANEYQQSFPFYWLFSSGSVIKKALECVEAARVNKKNYTARMTSTALKMVQQGVPTDLVSISVNGKDFGQMKEISLLVPPFLALARLRLDQFFPKSQPMLLTLPDSSFKGIELINRIGLDLIAISLIGVPVTNTLKMVQINDKPTITVFGNATKHVVDSEIREVGTAVSLSKPENENNIRVVRIR